MKSRVVSIILVGVMLSTVLTGCGTQVEATDKEVVMEEEEVIITTEDTETEATVTDSEIVEDEEEVADVPVEVEETVEEIPSNEFGNFIIFKEKKVTDYEVNLENFYSLDAEYEVKEEIPVYYTSGNQAGYVKAGTTISIKNGDAEWLRFEPNTEGITVPFLMVRADELQESTSDTVTTTDDLEKISVEEVEDIIVTKLKGANVTFLDSSTSDMESLTFNISKFEVFYAEGNIESALRNGEVMNYTTFSIECVETEKEIECTVYYK